MQAGSWDLALIADCDTIPDHDAVARAMEWIRSTGGGARPHDERWMLNQQGSIVMVQRGPRHLRPGHFARRWAGGGLDVVTRDAWEAVGGFDESWIGWGYEDSAFHLALIKQARWDRLPGESWHLWHPTTANRPSSRSLQRYRNMMRSDRAVIDAWAANKGLARAQEVI